MSRSTGKAGRKCPGLVDFDRPEDCIKISTESLIEIAHGTFAAFEDAANDALKYAQQGRRILEILRGRVER